MKRLASTRITGLELFEQPFNVVEVDARMRLQRFGRHPEMATFDLPVSRRLQALPQMVVQNLIHRTTLTLSLHIKESRNVVV